MILHETYYVMKKRRTTPFSDVCRTYGLDNPHDIKLHIIFINLKQLILAAYGDNPKNQFVLNEYQQHWQACEREEARLRKDKNSVSGSK